MYQLFGSLKAIEGKRDQLTVILLEAAKLLSEINECKLYIVSKDNSDHLSVWIQKKIMTIHLNLILLKL